jgi:cell division protein FtsI/penicillin-binding protein 2
MAHHQVRRRDVLLGALSFTSSGGAAVLMRVADRRILTVQGSDVARRSISPPGSAVKPLSLLALIEAGKLGAEDQYVCPRQLVIDGHSLPCSHPIVPLPMNVSRAIAYSCNCAVAHFAQRFERGELSTFLIRAGFSSITGLLPNPEAYGRVAGNLSGPRCQLQALGEEGVAITPLELLFAYRSLARRVAEPRLSAIIEGLEGAVEFGTARAARLERVKVAGKTGSVMTESGAHAAWFAGFAPSRTPEVAVVVLTQGRSGGADAAPLASELLKSYFEKKS